MTNYCLKYNKAIAALAVAAAGVAACASAQAASARHIGVTVTEPSGRIVTGLEREDVELIKNSVHQAITRFLGARSPISLAIVSKEPVLAAELPITADELIQTASLSAPDIELATVNRDSVAKVVAELQNQYRLEFESAMSSTNVEVVVGRRPCLPQLKVNGK